MTRMRRLSFAAALLLALLSDRGVAQFDVNPDHYDARDDSASMRASQSTSVETKHAHSQALVTGYHKNVKHHAAMKEAKAAVPSRAGNVAIPANPVLTSWQPGSCVIPTSTVICAGPKCMEVASRPVKMKCPGPPY